MAVIWVPVCVVSWAVVVNLMLPEPAVDSILIATGLLIGIAGIWRVPHRSPSRCGWCHGAELLSDLQRRLVGDPGGGRRERRELLLWLQAKAREEGIPCEVELDGTEFRHPLDVE